MIGIQLFHKQLLAIQEKTHESYQFEVEDKDSVRICMAGPNGTPYQSGTFSIALTNLDAFPKYTPIVFFQTRIWHPLVELHTGRVCPALLNEHWSSYEGVEGFLNRLQAFFSLRKVEIAINTEAAAELQQMDGSFEQHAFAFTKKYASS
jgi:ubiquitin-protein ligase